MMLPGSPFLDNFRLADQLDRIACYWLLAVPSARQFQQSPWHWEYLVACEVLAGTIRRSCFQLKEKLSLLNQAFDRKELG
jgi:hypothetical protein